MDTVPIFAAICFWIVAIPCVLQYITRAKRITRKAGLWLLILFAIPCLLTCFMARMVILDEPLLDAAHENSSREVARCLLWGANANSVAENGDTPLIYAAENQNVTIAALLLRAGADPNKRGDQQATPLGIARSMGDTDMVSLLLAAGAK